MKKVLIINSHYYPGWRSGGPQQTIMNIVDVFGSKTNIYILTHNYDMGEQEPYPDIRYDTWTTVGKAQVYYSSKKNFNMSFLKKMVNQFDLVYLCGPYCDYSYKTLLLNRLKCIKAKVVLAPMGSFSNGALSHKKLKKEVFWMVFRWLGLYNNIMWSFTSEMERQEASLCIGKKNTSMYYIAEDLPRRYISLKDKKNTNKKSGNLKIIFLSRICPQKNLLQAIHMLYKVRGNIQFDIFGPKEDLSYWKICENELNNLSSSIKWNYCGEIKPERILDIFLIYDVFLLPTMGENYGHVIYESLVAGCIPLISDRTPWENLEDNECGYSTPLEDIDLYIERIQKYVDMDNPELYKQQENAMIYAEKKYQDSVQSSGYNEILY